MSPRRHFIVLLWAVCCLSACSYPLRNESLPAQPTDQYTWDDLAAGEGDTLVVVTASGGGTRAAALASSVLQAMDRMKFASGRSLADRVDIISSVSGGSVTAAQFALEGTDGLKTLDRDFLNRDGMAPLVANLLNPFSLAILSTPSKERIDLLIDYLDRQVYHGATFQQLAQRKKRPYLILNAADMVEGTPFPFTQYTMDLLCSDLTTMKISTAVAASAAFPVALSPVTLKNYCTAAAPANALWLSDAQRTRWYTNPARVTWARTAQAYANGSKQFIHLLDGGIADNLGVAEPYRIITAGDGAPDIAQDLISGRIKKIVFVMVNARSFKPSRLDNSQATPGMLDMALASIDSSIDRATFNTAERLRSLLQEQFLLMANQVKFPAAKANYRALAENIYFLPVDFDAIADRECRRKFHSIATNWSLPERELQALKSVGGALLMLNNTNRQAVDKMLAAVGARVEGEIDTIDRACAIVPEPPAD